MVSNGIPQQPNTWDFTAALDLLDAFRPRSPLSARPSRPPETPSSPSSSPLTRAHLFDPKTSKPSALGDLNRLFDFLGLPHDSPSIIAHDLADSTLSSISDKSTPPSSLLDDAEVEDLASKAKEVRWKDEENGSNIAGYGRRRSTRSPSTAPLTTSRSREESDIEDSTPSHHTRSRRRRRAGRVAVTDTSEYETEPEYPSHSRRQSKHSVRDHRASDEDDTLLPILKTTLIPSTVIPIQRPKATHALWPPLPAPSSPFNPHELRPIDILTRDEKYAKLLRKLQKRFQTNFLTLMPLHQDYALKNFASNISPDGIHVFVDCSNIVIGFINQLKIARGMDVRYPAKGGNISWPALAIILERGRSVARRVLAGSHGSPLESRPSKPPDYLTDAEKCGYELNILERVVKRKDVTPRKRQRGNGNGYATTSGYSSGSDGTYMTRKAVAEQGVDELLHMKLLESLVDTDVPSTIVLASGDAAEAEYSGGFMKNVERALEHGWKVELVAWSSGLSRDYQSGAFLKKWNGRFSIVLLDDFSEEMFAVYADKSKILPDVQRRT